MDAFFGHLDANTLVLVVVGALLGIQQWRAGSSKVNTDTIQAYKDQLEITEKRYQTQQETLNSQAGQIGELKGLIAGKDAQITDYRKILENRNPDLEKILTELVHFMQVVDNRLAGIAANQTQPVVAEKQP